MKVIRKKPADCGANTALCLLLPVLVSAFSGLSEANDYYLLDEVVVTATKTKKALIDVPVRTEVVNRQQIEKIHARDLKDALANVPGLILKKIHGKSGYSVWLQGLDSERVLVLIDGEPVSASTGSTVDLTQISTSDIERIEIVKGASSALYGSSAMGGVINVITRQPEKSTSWSLVSDGGSWGEDDLDDANAVAFRHAAANFSLNGDQWSLLASADIRDSDGYDLDKSTFSTQGSSGHKVNIQTRLSYRPDSHSEIYFAPKFYQEDIQNQFATVAPGTTLGEIRKSKKEQAERDSITIGAKTVLDNETNLSGYVLLEKFRDDTVQDVIATEAIDQQRNAQIDTAKLELQWDQPLGDNQVITSGAVYFEESLDQSQQRLEAGTLVNVQEIQENAKRDNYEIYIQDDIFLNDNNEILIGLRSQQDSDFGSHSAPKFSWLLSPDWIQNHEIRVRTSIGKGYRVPNLKERFFIFDHSALGYMVLGNSELQPEESLSYQLGTEIIGSRYRFDINYFYNDIDDLIETDIAAVQDIPGVQKFEYVNIANAQTQGLELTWDQQLADQWRYSVAYIYLETEDQETGNTLPDRPEDQIKIEIGYDYKPLDISLSLFGTYQSEEFVNVSNSIVSPSWTLFDFKFNQRLSSNLSWFFGIDNLANEHRQRFDGTDNRPDQGRFVYAGLRLNN